MKKTATIAALLAVAVLLPHLALGQAKVATKSISKDELLKQPAMDHMAKVNTIQATAVTVNPEIRQKAQAAMKKMQAMEKAVEQAAKKQTKTPTLKVKKAFRKAVGVNADYIDLETAEKLLAEYPALIKDTVATVYCDDEALPWLLERGADPNAWAEADQIDRYADVYQYKSASIDVLYSSNRPLGRAITFDRQDAMKLLVKYGADVNDVQNKVYTKPMHYAAYNGDLKTLQFLRKKGAGFNVLDYHGNTVAHYAAGGLNVTVELLQFLQKNGVNLKQLNKNGESVLAPFLKWSGNAHSCADTLDTFNFLVKQGVKMPKLTNKDHWYIADDCPAIFQRLLDGKEMTEQEKGRLAEKARSSLCDDADSQESCQIAQDYLQKQAMATQDK